MALFNRIPIFLKHYSRIEAMYLSDYQKIKNEHDRDHKLLILIKKNQVIIVWLDTLFKTHEDTLFAEADHIILNGAASFYCKSKIKNITNVKLESITITNKHQKIAFTYYDVDIYKINYNIIKNSYNYEKVSHALVDSNLVIYIETYLSLTLKNFAQIFGATEKLHLARMHVDKIIIVPEESCPST